MNDFAANIDSKKYTKIAKTPPNAYPTISVYKLSKLMLKRCDFVYFAVYHVLMWTDTKNIKKQKNVE